MIAESKIVKSEKYKKVEKRVPPREEDIKWTNRCYGYIRVSTKMQVDDGISLEVQKAKIEVWCQANELELVQIFEDRGISGTSMNGRDGLKTLMDTIKQGETMMALSISRISRSASDFLALIDELNMRGCRLILYTERFDTKTPYGRFAATLFSAVAELEVNMTKQRVAEAMHHKMEKGEFIGRPPYGWKLSNGPGSDLVEVPTEQVAITKIRDLRDGNNPKQKKYAYEKIAAKLNRAGFLPPGKSKEWNHKNVSRIYARKGVVTKNHNRHQQNIPTLTIE